MLILMANSSDGIVSEISRLSMCNTVGKAHERYKISRQSLTLCTVVFAIRGDHISRSADAIGSRAARMAGNKPPIKPMSADHTMPRTSNSGVTLKANVIWLKL